MTTTMTTRQMRSVRTKGDVRQHWREQCELALLISWIFLMGATLFGVAAMLHTNFLLTALAAGCITSFLGLSARVLYALRKYRKVR